MTTGKYGLGPSSNNQDTVVGRLRPAGCGQLVAQILALHLDPAPRHLIHFIHFIHFSPLSPQQPSIMPKDIDKDRYLVCILGTYCFN